jgi:hypothetical protein
MTTEGQPYPTRLPFKFQGKEGQVVLDQIRTVGKSGLVQTRPYAHGRTACQGPTSMLYLSQTGLVAGLHALAVGGKGLA